MYASRNGLLHFKSEILFRESLNISNGMVTLYQHYTNHLREHHSAFCQYIPPVLVFIMWETQKTEPKDSGREGEGDENRGEEQCKAPVRSALAIAVFFSGICFKIEEQPEGLAPLFIRNHSLVSHSRLSQGQHVHIL